MKRMSLASFFLLCGLTLALPALAGPRLIVGFVGVPAGTNAASCSNAAKSSLDPDFGNARIQNGNGHAFTNRHTVIVFCDLDVKQIYILVAGDEASSSVRDAQELKDRIKARLLQSIPGSRGL